MCDEPARAYDLYVERKESEYQERIASATCGDCANCREPDGEYKNPDNIAWCKTMGEFVSSTDRPQDYECEDFE